MRFFLHRLAPFRILEGETVTEEGVKKNNHVLRKLLKRQQDRTHPEPHIDEQFGSCRLLARITSRPGPVTLTYIPRILTRCQMGFTRVSWKAKSRGYRERRGRVLPKALLLQLPYFRPNVLLFLIPFSEHFEIVSGKSFCSNF